MNEKRRLSLWAMIALVVVVSMIVPWTALAYVGTDKPDYSPGEIVTISGGSDEFVEYFPGETLQVLVDGPVDFTDVPCLVPDPENPGQGLPMIVGDEGTWSCQVTLLPDERADGEYTFDVLRDGLVLESGTFTDSAWDSLTAVIVTASPLQALGGTFDITYYPFLTSYLVTKSGTTPTTPDTPFSMHALLPSFTISNIQAIVGGCTYSGPSPMVSLPGAPHTTTTVTLQYSCRPTVTVPADQTANEGASTSFILGSFTDPEDGGPWTVDVNWGDGSTHSTFSMTVPDAITAQSHTYDDNGSYTVTVKVTDSTNLSAETTFSVTVSNVAPTATFAATSPIDEGGSSSLSFSNQYDPSSANTTAGFHYSFACDGLDNSLATSYAAAGTSATASCTFADNGSVTAKGRIFDKDDGYNTYSAVVAVNNVPPSVTITSPADLSILPITPALVVTYQWTDPGADTFTCAVDWGDGAGYVPVSCTPYSASATHAYAEAGVYTIGVRVTDDDGGEGTATITVVIYDPSAGFVTGGGWTDSPAGAYKPDTNLSGRATFGFVSKYKKGAQVPTGTTQFQFGVAGFSFYSETYEWLVVNQSGTNAQFKGSGTVNGGLDPNGNEYKFMIWAGDGAASGGSDTFRIKIWWEDNGTEIVVYDNGGDQPIGGGNIVIHTK